MREKKRWVNLMRRCRKASLPFLAALRGRVSHGIRGLINPRACLRRATSRTAIILWIANGSVLDGSRYPPLRGRVAVTESISFGAVPREAGSRVALASTAGALLRFSGPCALRSETGCVMGVCLLPAVAAVMAVRRISSCVHPIHLHNSTPGARPSLAELAASRSCTRPLLSVRAPDRRVDDHVGWAPRSERVDPRTLVPERLCGALREGWVADLTRRGRGALVEHLGSAAGNRAPGGTRHSGRVHGGIPTAVEAVEGGGSILARAHRRTEGWERGHPPAVVADGWFKEEYVHLVSR